MLRWCRTHTANDHCSRDPQLKKRSRSASERLRTGVLPESEESDPEVLRSQPKSPCDCIVGATRQVSYRAFHFEGTHSLLNQQGRGFGCGFPMQFLFFSAPASHCDPYSTVSREVCLSSADLDARVLHGSRCRTRELLVIAVVTQ